MRIKEQETSLTLQEHDDDDIFNIKGSKKYMTRKLEKKLGLTINLEEKN